MITEVDEILHDLGIPALDKQRARNKIIRKYIALDELLVDVPDNASPDHKKLAEHARSPWASKAIQARVQHLSVAGIKDKDGIDMDAWKLWRQWRMAIKEPIIYTESMAYADVPVELRKQLGNKTMPYNKSPFYTTLLYGFDDLDSDFNSDYPVAAIESNIKQDVYKIWLGEKVYWFEKGGLGSTRFNLVKQELHGAPVVPFVRYVHEMDSDGKTMGLIEPMINDLNMIFKTDYDQSLVQHHNSFAKLYATGLAGLEDVRPLEGESDEEFQHRVARMEEGLRLEISHNTLLTSPSKDTEFGQLEATDPGLFVLPKQEKIREFAALTNTPSEMMTGEQVTMSAEQAAYSRSNHLAVLKMGRKNYGSRHEALLRLDALMTGKEVKDFEETIVWEQDDANFTASVVDSLGKQKALLDVPGKVLWDDIPGMNPQKMAKWEKAYEEDKAEQNAAMRAITMMGNDGRTEAEIAKDLELGGGL